MSRILSILLSGFLIILQGCLYSHERVPDIVKQGKLPNVKYVTEDEINNYVQNNKPKKIDLANKTDSEICDEATFKYSSGRITWKYNPSYSYRTFENEVKEAKRRGLDCGVKENNKIVIASKPIMKQSCDITDDKLEYGGLTVEKYTKKLKEKYKIKLKRFDNSIVITSIKKGSSAYVAGLQEGMSILSAGQLDPYLSNVTDICGFYRILEYQKTKSSILSFLVTKSNYYGYRYGMNRHKYAKKNIKIFTMKNLENEFVNFPNKNNQNIFISNKKIKYAEFQNEKQKRIALQRKLEEKERKSEAQEKEIAELRRENKELQQPKQKKQKSSNEIGSGFYVSKFRHIVTNQHVVNQCKKITVGNSISKQIPATLVASNKRDDLAILQTVSMDMASADIKSFIQNLSIEIVPIISGGLMRSEDVKGGEEIVVAGYPLGNMVSDTIKVTKGIVSATRGMDNNFSQFEIDAVIRKGNSGGPIYDKRGNIVGVAVSRLSVNRTDTINFGIKGSTVKQFLSANDVPTTWANRAQRIDTQDLYKIASKQTVMVVCHR